MQRSEISNQFDSLVDFKSTMYVRKGQTIYRNYLKTNAQYLMYHGFVIEDNFVDCLELEFELFNQNTKFILLKKILLTEIYKTPEQEINEEQNIQRVCLSQYNLFSTPLIVLLKVSNNNHMAIEDFEEAVSDQEVFQIIMNQIQKWDSQFDQSIEEDQKQMEQESKSQILKASISYRIQQRKLGQELIKQYNDVVQQNPQK